MRTRAIDAERRRIKNMKKREGKARRAEAAAREGASPDASVAACAATAADAEAPGCVELDGASTDHLHGDRKDVKRKGAPE